VLSIGLSSSGFEYQSSRAACTDYSLQTAQLSIGATADYRCFYVATRVEYSATEEVAQHVPALKTRFIFTVLPGAPPRIRVTGALVNPVIPGERVTILCVDCPIGYGLYGNAGFGGFVRRGDVGRLRADIVMPKGRKVQLFGFAPGNHTNNEDFDQFYEVVVPPGSPRKVHLKREYHPKWFYG
jgi:hypothetical protein